MTNLTAIDDTPEFEDVPDNIAAYLMLPAWGQHPEGFLDWAHEGGSARNVHTHAILENNTVAQKNAMADHIETYHKNRRQNASG